MDLSNELTKNEINLLSNIGINVEEKTYGAEELRACEQTITEHIMNQSLKNGDLYRVRNQYNEILNKIGKMV